MLELARMQLVARPDEALDLLTTASTRGLSSASVLGAQLLSGQAQRIKDADEKAARFVDAYAWALVAQIRNDPAGVTFTDHIERIFGLSNSEKAMACSKAATIYGNLTSARSDSGLAGFDNSPPVRALRDLSQIGAECADWPTQRPNCNLVPFGDDLPLVKVYECSLQE